MRTGSPDAHIHTPHIHDILFGSMKAWRYEDGKKRTFSSTENEMRRSSRRNSVAVLFALRIDIEWQKAMNVSGVGRACRIQCNNGYGENDT